MADVDKTFTQKVEEVMLNKDAKQALALIKRIRELLNGPDVDEQRRVAFERLKARLMAVAFTQLADSTIERVFEEYPAHLLGVFDADDMIDRIKARLQHEAFVGDRDTLRDAWRAAMERSQQRLGGGTVLLGAEQVPATVGNWIKVYVSSIGTQRASTVSLARFFSQNRDIQALSPEARDVLRKIIDIFEFLKLRSEDLEGAEGEWLEIDNQGFVKVIADGTVEPLFSDTVLREYIRLAEKGELDAATLIDLKIMLPDTFGKYKAPVTVPSSANPVTAQNISEGAKAFIQEQKKKYSSTVADIKLPSGANEKAIKMLEALKKPNSQNIALASQILQSVVINKHDLNQFLSQRLIAGLIQNEFPKELGDKNKALVKQSIMNPVAVQALLAIIFKNKFELSDEEALWHSYEVVQEFPLSLKDFKKIVTYDVNKGRGGR